MDNDYYKLSRLIRKGPFRHSRIIIYQEPKVTKCLYVLVHIRLQHNLNYNVHVCSTDLHNSNLASKSLGTHQMLELQCKSMTIDEPNQMVALKHGRMMEKKSHHVEKKSHHVDTSFELMFLFTFI